MGRYVDEGVIFEGVGVLGVVMFLVLICSGFAVRGSQFGEFQHRLLFQCLLLLQEEAQVVRDSLRPV